MKPTYEELEQMLEESRREFGYADITMQNPEAKCEKLAAENAGLKGALEWLYEAVSMPDSGPIPDKYYSAVTNAAAVMHETPATDAFLAEVRAQARNELIDELEARFAELSQTSPTPELRSGAAGDAGFVSTFRKGVQS